MAVRYDVGTDYWSYRSIFLYDRPVAEPWFNWLYRTIYSFSKHPQAFFIVTSVIICAAYYAAIYKESFFPAYSILLFVIVKDYFIAMNAVRQYIAIAVILYSIPYIKKRKWIVSLSFVAVAAQFHHSAIILIPLVVLYYFPIRPVIGTGIMVGLVILAIIIRPLIISALTNLGLYYQYFTSSDYGNSERVFNWQYTVILTGPYILMCYLYKKAKTNANLRLLYSGSQISLFILALSAALPTLITRLTWYMNPLVVLYLPEAIHAIDDKRLRMVINVLAVVLYSIVAVRNILGGAQTALPYQTFWS